MKIRIYQINLERDKDQKAFQPYDKTDSIDSKIYDLVFDGALDCKSLEDIYYSFNMDHPAGYKGRSLSVSDVVERKEDGQVQFYFCDRIGFKEISFEPMKTTIFDLCMYPEFTKVREKVKEGFHPVSKGYAGDGIYYDDKVETRYKDNEKRYYPALHCPEAHFSNEEKKTLYPLYLLYGEKGAEIQVVIDEDERYLQISTGSDCCYVILPDGTCHMA